MTDVKELLTAALQNCPYPYSRLLGRCLKGEVEIAAHEALKLYLHQRNENSDPEDRRMLHEIFDQVVCNPKLVFGDVLSKYQQLTLEYVEILIDMEEERKEYP